MLNALIKHLTPKRVTVYSIDVEVTLDLASTPPRTLRVPHNISASTEDEARLIALDREHKRKREIALRGEPRVVKVRKVEMKGDW